MNTGRLVVLGIAAATVLAGGVVYYLETFVHYQRVADVKEVSVGARAFAVSDYDGLTNDTLPLRLRGCFQVAEPEAVLSAGPPARHPTPFGAPGWFACWDAAELDADLKAGRAQAVVAEVSGEGKFEMERVVAVYPDGRAFQWRRLTSSISAYR